MRLFSHHAVTGALLAFPLLAVAADQPETKEPGAIEVCRDLSFIGREIMQYRQRDKPMSEALTKAIE